MKAILTTSPDWSSRTTSDWGDCTDRNIWDELFDIVRAFREECEAAAATVRKFFEFLEKLPPFIPPRSRLRPTQCRVHPNTIPLGTGTYLYKAKEMKNLARSTKTDTAHKGSMKSEQCKHTFEITKAHCAPCAGYNVHCKDYEKRNAADTKM